MDVGLPARKGPACQTFGPFVIDTDRAEVTRDGATVPLRPKTFSLLLYLVDRAGSVVSKHELLDAVWQGVVVTDDSLTQAVSELRHALGDGEQALIRTVSRRGYRLDAAVQAAPASVKPAPPGAAAAAIPPALPSTGNHTGKRHLVPLIALAIAMAMGALVLSRELLQPKPEARIGSEVAARQSIVVMPFTDLSDPPAPHVAQAVDTDLAADLGRFADTRVVPRGSAAALGTSAQVDLKRVAKELGVRHVVTGSVTRDGEKLHIAVQLSRADTGEMVWSGRYDYLSAADWLARREVSARIANLLDRRVHETVVEDAGRTRESNGAIDSWMRGTYLLSRVKTLDDLRQARAEFEAALARQPDSSHALAGLASTHVLELAYRWTADRAVSVAAAEQLSRRALEIDPQNHDAQYALRNALIYDGRLDEAMVIVRSQLAGNPSDAHANRDLAVVLFFQGRWEEALRQVDYAVQLDPLDSSNVSACASMAATTLVVLGRYDEAIERARLVNEPSSSTRQLSILAAAEALRGNLPEAQRYGAALLQAQPNYTLARAGAMRGSNVPAYWEGMHRFGEGLRLAGLPDGAPPAR
jgi:DNA-binding winged helix-turn-helix (wHTH) protein/TolB-like protein/Tfp pilus assembly protein PilF